MKMISVSSSNIVSIGYENDFLDVRFRDNRTYRYFHVPESVFQELMNAPSKGKYLDLRIKGHFPFQLLS
jgi:hypothetical protein